jgi:hypothetical protein
MNWKRTEQKMADVLNQKLFKDDPIQFSDDEYNSYDCSNKTHIIELKNREKYSATAFNGSFIEKIKFDPLIEKAKKNNKIPTYIVRFNGGEYYSWNLDDVTKRRDLVWRTMNLPKTSHFNTNYNIDKQVADLFLEEAILVLKDNNEN